MGRTVVTGAAGFLASYVCDRLLDEGHEVIGLDNFITGRPENVRHLSEHPKFQFIEQDVSLPFQIEGEVDYAAMNAELRAIGYDGPMISEVPPCDASLSATAESIRRIIAM